MAIILPRNYVATTTVIVESATAKNIKKMFISADDNFISYNGTSWSIQKNLRFSRNKEEMDSSTLIIKSELMSSLGTSDMGIFIDNEISPRRVLSSVGTGFELLNGTAYIGDLSDGVHLININFRNLYNGTTYNKLVELYEKI